MAFATMPDEGGHFSPSVEGNAPAGDDVVDEMAASRS
jgi:hypothetical protein